MSADLSQFFQVFFEESAEHLAEMERILLSIDIHAPDAEELHGVFRAAHSIKGGAATFGFGDMAATTHTLESLLDRVRHHELALTAEMVDVFLETKDAIAMLLAGHRDHTPVDEAAVESACSKLRNIESGEHQQPAVPAADSSESPSTDSPVGVTDYRIMFTPPADLFMRGVRVEPLFDELASLGELSIAAQVAVPDDFGSYDPEQCYLCWDMSLTSSTAGLEELRDIFMFVADEEEIVIEVAKPVSQHKDPAVAAPTETSQKNNVITTSPPPESPGRRLYDRDETAPNAFGRRPADGTESSSIRVGVSKVDQLINQMGELVITQAMLAQATQQFDPVLYESLHRGMALLQRNTRDLQESVMSIRMMPISFIFSRFPRLVHDLAAKLGKQAELKLAGETTELDKGLIEKLADPLTHLVRNSLDHGIESPEARKQAGKPPNGTITLRAAQTGGRIVIEVIDDGAGLNRSRILQKASENGLVVSDEMSDEEVWQLIFAPGFSTAEKVTDVSGRGVGMDVVMKNVQAMGGRVSIFSESGRGSRVLVSLPLTLAILDGLSVRVGSETFVVPLNSIIESLQPQPADISAVSGNTTVRVRGEYLPLLRLNELYSIKGAVTQPEQAVVMIVDAEGEQVALLVDELLNQHQVVIKSLEANYRKVDGTAGATIMGDGHVALILDVGDLVHLWRKAPQI
ncbi:MAG: chemotaxis protein CheW [Geobacteraceae bacterium]|nr:chemotaxis protein CheW [Geobacteraceae bacterium]